MISDKELRKNGGAEEKWGNPKSWLREMFFDRKRLSHKFVTFLENIYRLRTHCADSVDL